MNKQYYIKYIDKINPINSVNGRISWNRWSVRCQTICTHANKSECQINIRYMCIELLCKYYYRIRFPLLSNSRMCYVVSFLFLFVYHWQFFDSVSLDDFFISFFFLHFFRVYCFLFGNHYLLDSCMSVSICCSASLFSFVFVLGIEHVFSIRHHHHHHMMALCYLLSFFPISSLLNGSK